MTDASAPPARRWRVRLLLVLTAAVGLPSGAAVLYSYPPTESGFYPPCIFHAATGLHCPGCGATRASHALLHGDVRQALAYNPLFVVALPLLAVGLFRFVRDLWTGRNVPGLRGWSVWLLFGVLLAYWVLRNVPVYPLTLLAPHQLCAGPPH
jgi:hypothetical protein